MSQDFSDNQQLIAGLEGHLEARYRLLVESVQDYAIFMLDPNGRIASWNIGAERIKGYAADEIIGQSMRIFYTPADLLESRPQRLLAEATERGHVEDEGWRLRKDGTRFWANVVITALRDESGELAGFAKVTRDLTERRQIEALKDQFLGILSHELRTPLNAILGFGSFLDEELVGELNPEQHRYIKRILGSADTLLALIGDLLDMSRIQAGKFSIHKEAVNFEEVVNQVFESLEALAEPKRITLVRDLPSSLPPFHADGQRLGQVLVNLISNAIKFSPPGCTVTLSAEVEDETLRCRVIDEGIGIAPEDLHRLFIPFSQLDSSNSRQAGGAGLGLSIIKALVEAHGGTVGVESVPHVGSNFWFSVPLEPVSERRRVLNQAD